MTREREEKREAERKEGGKFIQEFHRALLHNRQDLARTRHHINQIEEQRTKNKFEI
jgi:hypothetical protein